jgi:hypothetical protein
MENEATVRSFRIGQIATEPSIPSAPIALLPSHPDITQFSAGFDNSIVNSIIRSGLETSEP